MTIRESSSLRAAKKKWVGKRVKYWLRTLNRDRKKVGPYYGTVKGLTTNQALIEDRLEGYTHRNSIDYNGSLIVEPDDKDRNDFPIDIDAEIID